MGLNAGLSLIQVGIGWREPRFSLTCCIQCYGTDVGGFAGPLPSPELFVRWVQFGCVNQRFCIHSFKPNKKDPSGAKATNMPWMVSFLVNLVFARLTLFDPFPSIPRLHPWSEKPSNEDTSSCHSCECHPLCAVVLC